jgi:PilZ domain
MTASAGMTGMPRSSTVVFALAGASCMTENRREPRSRTLKAGTITFDGGGIDCTVRNRSSQGAALDVASPLGIPEVFTLVVPTEGVNQPCRVIWRKETRIGVIFI